MAFVRGIGGTPLNIFTHDVWYEHTLHPHPPIRKDPRAEGHDLKMPFWQSTDQDFRQRTVRELLRLVGESFFLDDVLEHAIGVDKVGLSSRWLRQNAGF